MKVSGHPGDLSEIWQELRSGSCMIERRISEMGRWARLAGFPTTRDFLHTRYNEFPCFGGYISAAGVSLCLESRLTSKHNGKE
jgi:hypothetical protein